MSDISATVTSQPISTTVTSSGVSAAVASSSSTVSAGGGVGPVGAAGPTGSTGAVGPANTLSIGTVTGGSSAAATLTGTAPAQVLSLVLPKGDTGAAGAAGSQGPQGPSGTAGATGAAGATGPQGPAGTAGAKGDTGSTGPQGPQGATGPVGAAGAKGDTGLTGATGLTGPAGATGSAGAAGAKGDTGSAGATGATGATGPQGPAGSAASATTSASDLTSGTLADARLSANVVLTGDSRLTDARTATSHTHGNLTNAGAIGSTTGQIVVTTASGVLTTAATIAAASQVSGLATVATSGLASDLSGTLADARLSSNIPTWATLAASQSQPSSTLDIYPRGEATSAGIAQGAGTIYLTFFTPSVSFTVSAITMVSGTTAAAGLTLARMGLYTMDETTATLVARTASDTTLFATVSTAYTRSLSTAGGYPATYTLSAGSRYAVAVICVGTTAPLFSGRVMNAGMSGLSPRVNSSLASQTDLVTSTTTFSGAQGQPWARLT